MTSTPSTLIQDRQINGKRGKGHPKTIKKESSKKVFSTDLWHGSNTLYGRALYLTDFPASGKSFFYLWENIFQPGEKHFSTCGEKGRIRKKTAKGSYEANYRLPQKEEQEAPIPQTIEELLQSPINDLGFNAHVKGVFDKAKVVTLSGLLYCTRQNKIKRLYLLKGLRKGAMKNVMEKLKERKIVNEKGNPILFQYLKQWNTNAVRPKYATTLNGQNDYLY